MNLNPKDKTRLLNGITELANSFTRSDAERDLRKNIVDDVSEDTDVDKKMIRAIAMLYHKNSFVEKQTENSDVETLYEVIFGNTNGA